MQCMSEQDIRTVAEKLIMNDEFEAKTSSEFQAELM